MNEQEQVAEALWRAEHAAFNWEGQALCVKTHYLCLAGVAMEKVDELRAARIAASAEPEGLISPELPGFDLGPIADEGAPNWRQRVGLE